MRIAIGAAVACLALIGLSRAADVQGAIKRHTDIPAQDLAPALRSLAKERGFQIVFASKEVSDLRTRGAVGEFTTNEALTQLLSGTNLTFRYLDENTITIAPMPSSSAIPAPGATQGGILLSMSGREALPIDADLPSPGGKGAGGEGKPRSFWQRLKLAEAGSTSSENQKSDQHSDKKDEAKDPELEEIIVTATRRAENIRDVPLSITAITADEIDRRRLVNAGDYLRGIPGVNQVDEQHGQTIVIRGIESTVGGQNYGSGVTTATYFGETPTSNSEGLGGASSIDLKLADIERVEVLRGPQGTAFGNSSMGGAVRTIPVAPKLNHVEGKLVAGYSETSGTGGDNYDVQAVGNIPLIQDKLAIRATAYKYQDSGFYRNFAGSDPAFRAAAVVPFGAEAFAVDAKEVGSSGAVGGRIAALLQASDKLRFTLSYLTQKSESDGWATANSGTYAQTVFDVAPEHVRRGQHGGFYDTDIHIANALMEYDIGWADLLASYSDLTGESQYASSFSVAVPWPVSSFNLSHHREHVGEVRLTTKLDGPWNFLAGLYAESLDDHYSDDYVWHGNPATNFFSPGQRELGDILDRRNLKQKAAFGEASWEFLPRWTFTGGVRAYEYDRTHRFDSTGALLGSSSGDDSTKASGTNFRANLSHKLNDHSLLYAGWSQGFRLGKPQPGLPALFCDRDNDGLVDGTGITLESTKSVNSDRVDSYELGGKFAFFDRRLTIDAAAFRMLWTDIPVSIYASCGTLFNTNAGAARSQGVELQASFPISTAFRVSLGGSWLNAELTKDVPLVGLSAGDRLPGSPKVNANLALQYDFKIGGTYEAFLRADSIYVGRFYSTILSGAAQDLLAGSGDYVQLDVSARVAVRNANIDLYVRNLTNSDEFVSGGYNPGLPFQGYRQRPRTVGIQLGYSFK